MDALFVIHQDADLGKIRRIIKNHGFRHIFVLTTHYPLGREQHKIANLAPKVRTTTMASLLSDTEMEGCDQKATEELLPRLNKRSIKRKYMGHFIDRSQWHKSTLVWQLLNSGNRFGALYFSPGLGVHSPLWRSVGGKSLLPPLSRFKKLKIPTYRRKIGNILRKRRVFSICHAGKCYCFISPVGRLKFLNNIEPQLASISRLTWVIFAFLGSRGRRFFASKIKALASSEHRCVFCTTIHAYIHELSELELPLHIFLEGYHPTNYPRSYVDMYENCKFVVRDMFGEAWFKMYGKTTLPPPPFMAPSLMTSPDHHPSTPLKRVLLALNHAGDWTALINRSDTDLLIEAFCQTAQAFPSIHFVVRLHPTMDEVEHEGVHSSRRIKAFIRDTNLVNLKASQVSLSTDLESADLVISEYSQVLLDAFQMGKLGLIANLTGRRSFMEDYEILGFSSVNSKETLIKWLEKLIRNPESIRLKQHQAAQNYNKRLIMTGYSS